MNLDIKFPIRVYSFQEMQEVFKMMKFRQQLMHISKFYFYKADYDVSLTQEDGKIILEYSRLNKMHKKYSHRYEIDELRIPSRMESVKFFLNKRKVTSLEYEWDPTYFRENKLDKLLSI